MGEDKDYKVGISITAQYQQLEQLNKTLERTKKQLSGLSKGRIDFNLRKTIQSSIDPIKTATDALNRAKNNYNKAILSGKPYETQLQNLKNVIKTIEHSKQLKSITEQVTKEYERQEAIQKAYTSAQTALEKFMLSLDPVKQKMAELTGKMKEAQNEFVKLNISGESTKGAEESIAKIKAQMDKLQESTQKSSSWFGKLMGRIRNISIYRAIRSGIKWLTSGVNEGLQGLAQYSSEVNSSMSNINNSLNQVRNTLAISFASVLQALEPIIIQLSDMLVDLINSFNLAMAKMQGKNVYTKAKKAADDYAKSAEKARKLSFDTFEVLSGGDDKTAAKDLFYPEEIKKDENALSGVFEVVIAIGKALIDITEKLGGLKTILITIVSIQLFKSVASGIQGAIKLVGAAKTAFGGLTTVFQRLQAAHDLGFGNAAKLTLKDYFKTAEGGINKLRVATTALTSVVAGLAAFALADTIFGQFKKEGKVIAGIIGTVAAALTAVAVSALAAAGALSWGIAIPAIVASIGVGVAGVKAMIQGANEIKGYETGGIPNKAELFYMNENGVPEALVNTGGSQTNVINIDQMSEGMRRSVIQAIYDTGLISAIRENNSSTIMVDRDVLGQTVASSAGFRNEMNRRNANLNLI